MEQSFSGEKNAILKIYGRAIQNWQEVYPAANPMKGIPEQMGMPRTTFYRKLRHGFSDDEQYRLFLVCLYPQGYYQLAERLLGHIKQETNETD